MLTLKLICNETHLQMEGAGRYGHRVDEHVESVLAHGARHELGAEQSGAGLRDGGRHGGAVGSCSTHSAQRPP